MEPSTQNSPYRLHPLHAILDVDAAARAGWTVEGLAKAFLDGGARLIQLRAKHLRSAAFFEQAERLVRAGGPYGASIVVNDRVDIARLSGAAGAHVGQDDLPPAAARMLLGPEAIVGRSTHTAAQVEEALRQPISYVAVGPVFGTQTKATGYDAVGPEFVAQAADMARGMPVVAIGGITLDAVPALIGAGAGAVAVISDLLTGGNPTERVRRFIEAATGRA